VEDPGEAEEEEEDLEVDLLPEVDEEAFKQALALQILS